MAKQRYLNTKLWSDNWISNLDPIEKLLFLYVLTNERTNICGIYELPLKLMAVETGIEKEMIIKILKRFQADGKIVYDNGWIVIINFIQHQAVNPKIEKGIAILLQNDIPDDIKTHLYKANDSMLYYEEMYLPESRKKNIRNIIKDKDVCDDCNGQFSKEELVVHHEKPLFLGGDNSPENLTILCNPCHKERHSHIPYDTLSNPINYSNSNSNSNTNRESTQKIKLNKKDDKTSSLSFLEDLKEEDLEKISLQVGCSKSFVKNKARDLVDYCKAKGKKYKDYEAFLRNACRKDYKPGPINIIA